MQGYSMVVGHFSSSITWLLMALRTTDTEVYLLQFGELSSPSKARAVHQHGTSSGGHHLSQRLLAAVRKFSFIHYEIFVHPTQSLFFIEVRVIFQESQISMWLPGIRTPLKPPFASRKMSSLTWPTRCSWSDPCLFPHLVSPLTRMQQCWGFSSLLSPVHLPPSQSVRWTYYTAHHFDSSSRTPLGTSSYTGTSLIS